MLIILRHYFSSHKIITKISSKFTTLLILLSNLYLFKRVNFLLWIHLFVFNRWQIVFLIYFWSQFLLLFFFVNFHFLVNNLRFRKNNFWWLNFFIETANLGFNWSLNCSLNRLNLSFLLLLLLINLVNIIHYVNCPFNTYILSSLNIILTLLSLIIKINAAFLFLILKLWI